MERGNIIGLIGAVLGVAVAVSIVSWFLLSKETTLLQGETDVTSYKASSKVAGRVDKMLVKKGQKVKKGELLYILSTPEIEAKLRQAKAAQSAARAQEMKAVTGSRIQDIQAAGDMWAKAEAAHALAEKSYSRAENLYNDGVIPAQKRDEAEANVKAMAATMRAAKAQYNMALEGARHEDKMVALALVQQAAGAVAEVEIYAADAKVYSPADGEISSILAEEGELIGAGFPVVTVLDMSDIWVSYNIKETLMPKIVMGQKMMAYVPALDREVEFYVDYISIQADFATWSATRTQGGFDIRTFNVKTRPTTSINNLRPGMSAILEWERIGERGLNEVAR